MKAALAILIALLFGGEAEADEWTATDTALEITYQLVAAIDWMQTRYISTHPVRRSYTTTVKLSERHEKNGPSTATFQTYRTDEYREEKNPALGKHPSKGKVDAYFLATSVIHTAISYGLTRLDTPAWMPCSYSRLWQAVTITGEGAMVGHNFSVGIGLDFPL